MRTLLLALCLVLLVVGCGNGELSMDDYATQLEDLVATMNQRVDILDAEREAETATLQSSREFWESKVAARRDLIAGMQAIQPPEDAAEMHATAISIIERLATTDDGVAQLVASMETDEELGLLLESPEFLATETVDVEAIALCQAAQAEFDSTADREVFGEMPWIPSELREVVTVVFGCTKEQRGLTP